MKRILAAALTAALLGGWTPPARSAVRATPLGRAGGILRAALPEIRNLKASQRKIPLALDTAKAAALLGQAKREGALAPAGPVCAREAVAAVNAVLKDFTPEAIGRLPVEDLHALSGLILDHLPGERGPPRGANLRGVAILANARTERLLALRGQPLRETLENPGHNENHADDIVVRGVPETVRLVRPKEEPGRERSKPIDKNAVFRHYTTRENLEAIRSASALWNGFWPYDEFSPYTYRKAFLDLTGLFFTLPGVGGEAVGRGKNLSYGAYVDVRLPALLPLLEIEPGRVYLLPLPGRMPGWIEESYAAWVGGRKSPGMDARAMRKHDAETGPSPRLAVPVQIIRRGFAR